MRNTFALAFAFALLAGCYNPSIPNGMQKCAAGGACAAGYTCGPDGPCYKNGTVPPPKPDMAALADMAMECDQASCKAPTPVCDPDSKQCVACLADGQCPDGKLCKNKVCVPGCSQSHGCGDAGMCNQNGMCATCMSDADCGGQTPRCDVASGKCFPCVPQNDNCMGGQFCKAVNGAYQCVTGCKVDGDCMNGGKCCNNACTDTATDGANCGACGRACAMGQSCCASSCTDTSADLANCGMCGTACAGNHANWSCAMAACAITSCQGSYKDCNMMAADGCESNTASDPMNCGGCGMACKLANAVAGCANGCFVQSCNMGFGNCNNMAADGCEVNLAIDKNNCGACGKVCGAVANGFPACVGSACAVGACIAGFGDCDMQVANGCETNTNTDGNNCGGCGMKCVALPNAQVGCSMGMCALGACNAGFGNCDNMAANGCEANLNTDKANCGGCGKVCSSNNIATPTCGAGVCNGACNAGFANCNGNKLTDGCEVNLNTDKNNCGLCGKVCANGQSCVNGACVVGGGFVYMTSSNGTAGFYRYDVLNNSWSTLANPPVVTYSQITSDGTAVYLLGNNNVIYKYATGAGWSTFQNPGPNASAANPIGFFKWTTNGFYYLKDGTTTMYWSKNLGAWSSFTTPQTGSCAGTFDPSSGILYERVYSTFGVMGFNTTNNQNTVTYNYANATAVVENSRTGSYYNGFFYERTFSGSIQKMAMANGAVTDTMVIPSESHTSTDFAPNGDLYIGPYSPTGTTFQVFHSGNNQLVTLAPAPVPLTNHSTIVFCNQ